MKLRLPKWFQQAPTPTPGAPEPTTTELVVQLETRLTEADAEVTSAEARSQELLAKFAEKRTPENLEDQESAETDLVRLRKLRALVVADLEAAKAKLAAEERARLEQEAVDVEARIQDNTRDNELVDDVVKACEKLVQAQAARWAHAGAVANLRGHLHGLRLKLGQPSNYQWHAIDAVPSQYQVVEKLKASIRNDEASKDRNRLTFELAGLLQQWR